MRDENEQAVVLVAEGRPGVRDALQQVLEQAFRVLSAVDGPTALRTAREYLPDLIILGELPPLLDALRVCADLKAEATTAAIPVLLFVSDWPVDDGAAGLAAGALDYLTLPLRPLVMRRRLRNYIDLRRYRLSADRLCREDSLTGVANRRYFDDYLEQEWRRAVRTGSSLSLLLVDVDQFRAFNERHGQKAGDRCLERVAGAIADSLQRATDLVARYAGEEFACVLPETGLEGALRIAERIREGVLGLEIPHGASPVAPVISVSLGVASIVPDKLGSTAQLLVAADRCLDLAKERGQNRVEGTLAA